MNTRIVPAIPDTARRKTVAEAVALLEAGSPVALPTETVYGLAADALNPRACAEIFRIKKRPLDDPLIVHLPSTAWLRKLSKPPSLAVVLAGHFWPGPLTLVLPRTDIVPDIVTAGEETVALRISAHPVFREIAASFGRPLAAPSANRFGRISPTSAADVFTELGGSIAMIVDGGPCRHGIESTIVRVEAERLQILRAGPVTGEMLAGFGEVISSPSNGPRIPGSGTSHYAPATPLRILGEGWPPNSSLQALRRAALRARVGLLAWSGKGEGYAAFEYLSRTQDLAEAAANLYRAMRRLDEAGLDMIVAEPLPETGLGVAIMERLRKAAARD